MKTCFRRLKNTPVYVKIVVVIIVVFVTVALSYRYVYYKYAWEMSKRYPWISGGTVVTYSEAPDSTLTLKVSLRTGIFIAPQVLPKEYAYTWGRNIGIAKKGEMQNYYYDELGDFSAISSSQWHGLMQRYYYYDYLGSVHSVSQSVWDFDKPKVTSIVIGEGVTRIGDYAFYRKHDDPFYNRRSAIPYLDSVVIANSVKYIGEFAFHGCDIMSPITIPSSVKYIGNNAFGGTVHIDVAADNLYYCSVDGVLFNRNKTKLIQYPQYKKDSAYTIPDGVTTIDYNAFYHSRQRAITIPRSVDSIETCAFSYSGYYSEHRTTNSIIVLNPIPPAAGQQAFSGINSYTCLYVPKGSETAYSLAPEWREFKCIRPIAVTGKD